MSLFLDWLINDIVHLTVIVFSGISNTPLHRFQLDKTLHEYCNPIIRLLALLLRKKTHYTIPLSAELQQMLDHFQAALNTPNNQLARETLHHILMGLWKHKWRRSNDHPLPCPTIRALALITLKHDGHFDHPKHVTTIIAKLERCIRLAFAKEIKHLSETMDEENATHSLQPWFTEKHDTPFNSLRSLQHRASSIAYTTTSMPTIYWTDRENWTSLLYKGHPLNLDMVYQVITTLENDLVSTWENKVLCGLKIRVDYHAIGEDLTDQSVGYSFISDNRNKASFGQRDRLLVAIVEDRSVRDRFLHIDKQSGKPIWNRAELHCWLKDYSRFQVRCLARAELLAGGAGRGTELTALSGRNQLYRARGTMWFDCYMAIVRSYHKSAELTGQDKMIPHALDALLADLLVQDLAIAKPFAAFAASLCYPSNPNIPHLYKDYLFVDRTKLFDSDDVTNLLHQYTQPIMGTKIGLNAWRHLSVAWKRKLCSDMVELYEGPPEDTADVLIFGHNQQTEARIYGISQDSLKGAAEDIIPLFMKASTKWQLLHRAVPGQSFSVTLSIIDPSFSHHKELGGLMLPYTQARASMFDHLVQQKTIKPYQFPGKASSDDVLVEKIIDKMVPRLKDLIETTIQSALSSHFPQSSHHHDSVPARTTTNQSSSDPYPPPSLSSEYSQPAYTLSDDDELEYVDDPHDSIYPGHAISSSPPPSSPPPTSIASSPSQMSIRSSSSSASHHSFFNMSRSPTPHRILSGLCPALSDHLEQQALAQIGKLLKIKQPSWTCDEQRIAMTKVLEAKGDVLAVMQTSSGKSMLMVIPSLVEENKITIGILPLNSLLSDYRRKLSDQGVSFEYYHTTLSPNLTGRHNLILVTIDQARTQGWKQQLAKLNTKIPVCRAVFDEAHFAITNSTFRKVLEDPHDLRAFPTMQMVLLSATIPPKTEPTIIKAFELSANCSIIRTPLQRSELQYILESPYLSNKDIAIRVQSIIEEANLEPRDRALIFVPYLDQGEVLAEVLKCDFYRGGQQETLEEKEAIYHQWIQGVYKVMVATSAFGAGNDYPHVRLIIHAGQPRNCMDYIQESSRGGRDQQPCQCIILPLHGAKPVEKQDEIDHMGIQNMCQLLAHTAPACIRHHLTAYNNGVGITCFQLPGCQPCSQCDPSLLPLPPQHTTKHQCPSEIEMAYKNSKRRRIEQTQKKTSIYNTLHEALSNLHDICAFCRLYGVHSEKHNIFKCHTLRQKSPHFDEFYTLRRAIHYSPTTHSKVSICYQCHIPQLDDAFHPTFQKGTNHSACRYGDCVLPVALGVYLDAEKKNRAEEYFQCQWGSIRDFSTWINGKASGDHASRLVEIFLWVCHDFL